MTKATQVIFKANGGNWTVHANGSDYKQVSGDDKFICVGSVSGGVDVVGEFFNDNIILQFEMSNPWIGSPWAAVGQAISDNGWDNDRTNLSEGESHVFTTTIYTDDDSFEFKTRVARLKDTDTKNFAIYPDW